MKKNVNPQQNTSLGISIHNNPSLGSLQGLESLRGMGYLLRLENLPLLESLQGLPNAFLQISNLTLSNMPLIKDLSPFSSWKSVDQGTSITLSYLPLIYNLNGLQGFTQINNLVLMHNSFLNDVKALQNSSFSGPLILVDDNGSLCDFTGLSNTASKVNGSRVFDTCGTPTQGINGSMIAPLPGSQRNGHVSHRVSMMMLGLLVSLMI